MRDFAPFLREALDTIAAGAPAHHRRLARLLRPVSLHLRVGREAMGVTSDGAVVEVSGGQEAATVRLETSRQTILALLDAETSLEDAVLDESIVLVGAVDDLLRFHDGLMAFLNGAVRCPELDGLLARYRLR